MYCTITYIIVRYRTNPDLDGLSVFEWDEGNLNKNRLRHGVEPSECEEIFFNKPIIVLDDPEHSSTEKRYKILGISAAGRGLSLAVTIRSNKIRIIMAGDQSKKERQLFELERKEPGGEAHEKT